MKKRAAQANFKKPPGCAAGAYVNQCPFAAGHLKRNLSAMAVPAHDHVCNSHDALCAIWFDGAIRVEHAITDNLPDGAPVLPGFVNDGIFWALVAPLPEGRTRWRRISLQQNMVRPLGVQDET